jgi:hypothetical protein
VRVSRSERARWTAEAAAAGETLSDLVRDAVEAELVRRQAERERRVAAERQAAEAKRQFETVQDPFERIAALRQLVAGG